MKKGFLMTALAVMAAAAPAQASTLTFGWVTPGNQNTVLGLSYAQTVSGVTLTAYGLTAPANLTQAATAGPALYAKNGGSGETGLGMASDPAGDHEISVALHDGIQVDFSKALAATPNATVTMAISSDQAGEGWALYGSNTQLTVAGSSKTAGVLGEPLLSGSGSGYNPTTTITLPDWGQYTYYTVMATDPSGKDCDANVLLGAVTINGTNTVTATPEPGALILVGSALLLIGVMMKKAQKKA
jgi:hypothetical protein